MIENLLFLATPLTAGIILAGILGYFGTHILSRGIIFIDIAIAQIAALGTMIGLLLGFPEESFEVQLISYTFTLLVMAGFALTKSREPVIPQEAIIGIIYCLGLALALLLAEKIPGGSNYITKTITGNILWVTWGKVLKCFLLFAAIGIIHLLFGQTFRNISLNNYNSKNRFRIKAYDLLFYLTFGIVIVKAVLVGGIFLVFILLIAPSAAAALFRYNWRSKIIWSWIIGIIGSATGIFLSYSLDISNGPAIVCLLGLLVFLLAFIRLLLPNKIYRMG
jgi:zinc/manganese transport system permease protein